MHLGTKMARLTLSAAVLAAATVVSTGGVAMGAVPVHRSFMPGFKPAGAVGEMQEHFQPPKLSGPSPSLNLNRVGVIAIGAKKAKNVLVLEPGTSAGAAYFVPFAKSLVSRLPDWQVWAVERRENLLEDQAVLRRAKDGIASGQELFDYYLGWLAGAKPRHRFLPLTAEGPSGLNFLAPFPKQSKELNEFGSGWGMNVAVEDLHRVIEAAKARGGKVVLGGHSLGGSVVTAYATWDFGGSPGADGLSGLVYDDGGSSPIPITKEKAEEELGALHARKAPWLAFGGIGAPFLGLFSALGSTATAVPALSQEVSLAETFPFLPENLKPKTSPGCKASEPGCLIPVNNEAEFGYGVNVGTSPPTLIAAQVHAGAGIEETAKEDGLHGWNGLGAISPLKRYAEMLSGTGLQHADGTEWYFPERLTIDTGAVADGNANPAQEVLEEHAIHGHDLPTSLKILAISSELDKVFGASSLIAAEVLAEQSGIPSQNLTLIDREAEYAHNDPAAAEPEGDIEANVFFREMVPFLQGLG